jgi:hypothetical protein
LFMVQRCKFSIELKNFPPDLSGEPILGVNQPRATDLYLEGLQTKKAVFR